jgi:hypothetical protein
MQVNQGIYFFIDKCLTVEESEERWKLKSGSGDRR